MSIIKSESSLFVISILILLQHYTYCDKPDICLGSPITAIEKVIFLDDVERYFVSSGKYYWFVNETSDLPTSDNVKELPFGFLPDAALIKDTRDCRNGQYVLLLIQKKHIIKSNEEEWLTMEYNIKEWGENGTDSGSWSQPLRIGQCRTDGKVCTTSDNYFATMNFDFKRGLDAAFGVIGSNAYFIQGSYFYNVTYKTQCVRNPYSEVIAQSPQSLKTIVTAGSISDNKITLFDGEFYMDLADGIQTLDSPNWSQAPNNFFTECSPLLTTLGTIFNDISRRSLSATLVTIVVIVCLLIVVAVSVAIIWMSLKRKTMRITSTGNVDETGESPLHEEHLLKNDSPKEVINDNKDQNQVRIPLQTSC